MPTTALAIMNKVRSIHKTGEQNAFLIRKQYYTEKDVERFYLNKKKVREVIEKLPDDNWKNILLMELKL